MMFPPQDTPRVFGVPPGSDFPQVLADEILTRFKDRPPEELARVLILVPTRRMQRRLKALISHGTPRLLPRIDVITDAAALVPGADLPAPVSSLRRSLELKQLVQGLLHAEPTLAPKTSVISLSESLAKLLDEMQSEGVSLDRLDDLNADFSSGHWALSLKFLKLIKDYAQSLTDGTADSETRQRMAVERLCETWKIAPPETPVIVAGSTGSRATTALLMENVARLPQGAVVLPGFDFAQPKDLWTALLDDRIEDHPQYRFAALLARLNSDPAMVARWGDAPSEDRNTLISLSLRPANVTDQWLQEGPKFTDLSTITQDISLIEAAQPHEEATAISLALRHAVENGETAALIAPDATLARRVTASLARWNIRPDDSAGVPLSLTPPGRFLRHVGGAMGRAVDPVDLIALLRHPLTRSVEGLRGTHLRLVQEFELFLRGRITADVDPDLVTCFAKDLKGDEQDWSKWLTSVLERLAKPQTGSLTDSVTQHVALAAFIAGDENGPGKLWETSAGEEAAKLVALFETEAEHAPPLTFAEYLTLFETRLSAESDRDQTGVRADVMIWGTLEARVQGADLVILGGLNEGTWPEQDDADPWLNRKMRRQIGLLLPERRIGLAAHDFQQAVAAKRVILSRSIRNEESQTVPSRWLNRLTNLLDGLPAAGGPAALNGMKTRGTLYTKAALQLDRPTAPVDAAKRPAPAPPSAVRPKTYSVTEIQRLIRDPYAIYAKRILRLVPLDMLRTQPDARLKGIVFHNILDGCLTMDVDVSDIDAAKARFLATADKVLLEQVPWPAARCIWATEFRLFVDWLIAGETDRLAHAKPAGREVEGVFTLPGTDFQIKGKADRIDRLNAGGLVIYDYKTGKLPTRDEIKHFDKQLLIEAVMAKEGGFEKIPPETVTYVEHIKVGRTPKDQKTQLIEGDETVTVSDDLREFLTLFGLKDQGYVARRAMETARFEGNYDHLARYGEWDDADDAPVDHLT